MMQRYKEIIRKYKEKTKGMTLKEKLVDYIWEYYKFEIIITILLVSFVGSYINSNFINPPNKPYSSISFFGRYYVADNSLLSMTSELNDALIPQDSKFEIYSYLFYVDEKDPEVTNMQLQRFAAMVAAKELDILFVEKEELEGLIEQDYVLSLDALFSENELEKLDEWLISDPNQESAYYGLDLEKSSPVLFKNAGCSVRNMALCVLLNTQNIENSAEVIKYIMGL